jgi:hypothetical protein
MIFFFLVIFLDWDDTLFPSSYLASKGYRLESEFVSEEVLRQLKLVEAWVERLLDYLATKGDVYVITNAETGWVELSSAKFIPDLADRVKMLDITSARSKYESMFPNSPLKWKFYAFKDKLITDLGPNDNVQVLSLGDSNYEREAAISVTKDYPNICCKSIKFQERPSVEQLLKQIELVIKSFEEIYSHDGDLDLQLLLGE